jgi:hypothetical protein
MFMSIRWKLGLSLACAMVIARPAVAAPAHVVAPPIRPPAPPGVAFAPVSPTEPSRWLTAQAYAIDAKISVDEALRRLEMQHRAEGVEFELRDALGPAYAGRWVDLASGEEVVATAGDKPVDPIVDEILGRRDLLEVSKHVTVASSLDDLEAAQADLNRMVDERFKAAHVRTGIDLVNNRVLIWLGDDATDEERQLAAARAEAWRKGDVDVGHGTAFPPSVAAAGPDYRSAGKAVDGEVVDLDGPADIKPAVCNTSTKYCDNPIAAVSGSTGTAGAPTPTGSARPGSSGTGRIRRATPTRT